jgi:hypothetical protein
MWCPTAVMRSVQHNKLWQHSQWEPDRCPSQQHWPCDPVRSFLNPNHSTIVCEWLTAWYVYVSAVDPNTFSIGVCRWSVPICLNLTIIPQAKLLLVYRQRQTVSFNCPPKFKQPHSTKIWVKIRGPCDVLLWIMLDTMGTERLAFVEPRHNLSIQTDSVIYQAVTAPTLANSAF